MSDLTFFWLFEFWRKLLLLLLLPWKGVRPDNGEGEP